MEDGLVRILRYAGDDEVGAYCEALVIQHQGKEVYVLHRGRAEAIYDRHGQYQDARFVHEKMEFPTEADLVARFPAFFSRLSEWQTTDAGCGYGITSEAHKQARRLMH